MSYSPRIYIGNYMGKTESPGLIPKLYEIKHECSGCGALVSGTCPYCGREVDNEHNSK